MVQKLNVLSIGASQNIGYHAALYLLADGHNVTFLLRRKNTFDENAKIQEYIKSGQVKLSFGDALSKDDLKKAWAAAEENGAVDYVIFTVGGRPGFSLTKGIYMLNPQLVSACMHSLLSIWPRPQSPNEISHTKLITVTTNGLTKKSHAALPFVLRILYNLALTVPHQDKRAVEQFISYSAAMAPSESISCTADEKESLIKSGHLYPGWEDGLQAGKWLEPLILRPSLYIGDHERSMCEEKGFGAIRVGPEDLKSAWTISRKDVSWFIAKKAVTEWQEWKGKAVTISN